MHGPGSLFTQELSMLLAHHHITNFTTRPRGGHLLEIDLSDLVSKIGGTSFSIVALIPPEYPNSMHKPILSPVDRDGSLGRDLLLRIGKCLTDSVQVSQGCPAILCAVSGVASILRDAAAEENIQPCEKAADPTAEHIMNFMRLEPPRKRSSEPGSSADTTASSCPSIKGWLMEHPQPSLADSSDSDSEDSDDCDNFSENFTTDDESELDQVQWELSANVARQVLRMKECRMAAE